MKATFLTIVMIICFTGLSSGQAYQNKMEETLQKFGKATSLVEYQKIANQFKLISNMEKEQWLPLYYNAEIYILMSFMDNSGAEKKDDLLAEADQSIQKMLKMNPNEVEIIALQAFYYTAKLVVDPMSRGQQYGMLFAQTIGKAMAIDGKNPRVRYLKLANDVGSAGFFGTDPKQFKGALELLAKEWDDYKIKSPIHPSWGKAQVEGLISQVSN